MYFRNILLLLFLCNSVFAQSPFVSAREGRFYKDGQPYYYVGSNYWYGSLLGQGASKVKGAARLRQELDFLKNKG
ncbi:MAG: beta-mannosidase, partial [Sphingobacteriales bacterium]